MTGLAIPVDAFQALDVSVAVRCAGLRGAGGAAAAFFFLDEFGKPLPGPERRQLFPRWADSSPWQIDEARVRVPPGAIRAVLQFEKLDAIGSIRIDDVQRHGVAQPRGRPWTPYHVADETDEWLPVPPSPSIAAKSALDVSFLVAGDRPARAGL